MIARYLGATALSLPLWWLNVTQISAHGLRLSLGFVIINSLLTALLYFVASTKPKTPGGKNDE